jgi:hypothetical protein
MPVTVALSIIMMDWSDWLFAKDKACNILKPSGYKMYRLFHNVKESAFFTRSVCKIFRTIM